MAASVIVARSVGLSREHLSQELSRPHIHGQDGSAFYSRFFCPGGRQAPSKAEGIPSVSAPLPERQRGCRNVAALTTPIIAKATTHIGHTGPSSRRSVLRGGTPKFRAIDPLRKFSLSGILRRKVVKLRCRHRSHCR